MMQYLPSHHINRNDKHPNQHHHHHNNQHCHHHQHHHSDDHDDVQVGDDEGSWGGE